LTGHPERGPLCRLPPVRRHHRRSRAQGNDSERLGLEHHSVLHLTKSRWSAGTTVGVGRSPKPCLKGENDMTAATVLAKGKRPEDERLGVVSSFAYGLQHVLTMYGGIIAVPLIIGQAAGLGSSEIALLIASGLFIGGIATILQSWGLPFFGCQLPLVQGVSFAGVATMLAT